MLRAVLLLGAFLAVMVPPAADAHVRSSTGFSTVRQHGDGVRYTLSVEYDLLAGAAGLGSAGLHAADDPARSRVLAANGQAAAAYALQRVRVFLDGLECTGRLGSTSVSQRQGRPYATLGLVYRCPGEPSGQYVLAYRLFGADDALVDEHVNITDYDLGGEQGRYVFDADHQELTVGATSWWRSASRFVGLGVEHILSGADHVLFVAALLIGARSLREVLAVASTFTVAHSVTLALAALGWVEVPAEIVEPLIALSIAFVAVQNVIRTPSRHRLPVVFGFGLLHGLGFASTLSFTNGGVGQLLSSLLTFNAGIELGQLLIVLTVFPLLLLVRRFRWSAVAHLGATSLVCCLGLVWFAQRLFA